jgi:pimeloyl-ACP methyl ester carboxylesterase
MGGPTETEISVVNAGAKLSGAWRQPGGARVAPPVVIIPGSGPTDRDGDNPLGVKAAVYRLLAEDLARQGIASVRIDKRGMFSSAAPGVDPNAVTVPLYAADANAWAAEARRRTGAPCAWLLGHSEGAVIALAAAQKADGLCGLILVSGPGRRLGDVLREQLRANPANAPLLPQAEAAISDLEAGRSVEAAKLHPALQPLFAPAVQPFLTSLFATDPAALARAYRGPILIVQGETDLQTAVADAQALKAARPDATLALLPDVNHVLKAAPADRAANLATYADPAAPLAPGVVDAIAGFIRGSRRAPA